MSCPIDIEKRRPNSAGSTIAATSMGRIQRFVAPGLPFLVVQVAVSLARGLQGSGACTEIDITGSSALVWKVLTRFEKYPEWNPFIHRATGELRGRSAPPDPAGK
jgi:hypothetical protein